MGIEDIITYDVRNQLPTKNWIIGTRTQTAYIVVHFNGPPVPEARQSGEGVLEQLKIDCDWQMRRGWAGVPSGADGLQYHYVIDQEGHIYRTRNPDSSLWHCGHRDANPKGVSVHLPIGYDKKTGVFQEPSEAMTSALLTLIGELRETYGVSRERVMGHVELGSTAYCPGTPVMDVVTSYRSGKRKTPVTPVVDHPPLPHLQLYKIKRGQRSTIRQGPSRNYDIVREIAGRDPDEDCPDKFIWVDAIRYDEQGLVIDGGNRWMHMAYVPDQQYDEGFIHETGLELVQDRAENLSNDRGIPDASPIIGGPFVPDRAIFAWLDKFRSHIPEARRHALARAYNYGSGLFGISNWLALHQADKETAGFTSERFVTYNNVAGMGATNDGARGAVFETLEQAVLAQFLHLYHYASRDDASEFLEKIADANPRLEPLLATHGRGSAPRWLDLHQKWAVVPEGQPVPGPTDQAAYGMNIILRARNAWEDLGIA